MFGMMERLLLRDLIFVFQGIDGQYVQYNKAQDCYLVSSKEPLVPKPMRELVEKMAEMGWMYKRIQGFIDQIQDQVPLGLVGQVRKSFRVMRSPFFIGLRHRQGLFGIEGTMLICFR